ncbi:MAG: glucose-1-phosphate thymidylyltransferase [Flavobacteriales bacterium]|nr:glucose-1-phosphate thymidylyltransferase [Flavobacteriales bacterium]
MARIVLFDGPSREHLLPLTFTRPVCHLRVGILTIKEKWEHHTTGDVLVHTQDYLSPLFGDEIPQDESLFVDGSVIPTPTFIHTLYDLDEGVCITSAGQVIAFRGDLSHLEPGGLDSYQKMEVDAGLIVEINSPADIFSLNGLAMEQDIQLFVHLDAILDDTNTVIGEELYMEPGAKINASVINTDTGPVYIGKNAEVMEGCMIRGPFSLGEGATLKMGTKIYGPTTIGPHSKVGGEVNNSVIQGYSNKGHDGFLGNSVIGEWCNLGADTNTSNLKNNYGPVRVWDYTVGDFIDTGKMFHGLVMGDHSKCGINTMFNTGTVVGVNANVFQAGFPPKFIPSYAWGAGENAGTYDLERSFEVARAVCARRDVDFGPKQEDLMHHIFELTKKYRTD